ncbi:ATP-dependent helicase/nuclease subunit A [Rickettsiales bacterium Ac37b]|nr:ATP-dependent helicase/nuclease subunit A [Rickettsiales bacterium Ac37b]
MFEQQLKASDPYISTWVKASAGTGKTKILTDRVLRLLLTGNNPAKILCLTFTKAAATEMATRINKELSEWAIIEENKLISRLTHITGATPTSDMLYLARQLFLIILDSPDILKIQTIHAFCQSLIQQFPIEAGLSIRHEVIEENKVKELLQEAKLSLLNDLEQTNNTKLHEAIKYMAWYLHEKTFNELLTEIVNNQKAFQYLFDYYEDLDSLIENTYRVLGLETNITTYEALKSFYTSIDQAKLAEIIQVMLLGTKTDEKLGKQLLYWLNLNNEQKLVNFEIYKGFFCTKENQPRKALMTQNLVKKYPEFDEYLQLELKKILDFVPYYSSIKVAHLTEHVLHISYALLERYKILKQYNNCLDYDDLISITYELLESDTVNSWILYKLDGGVNHVLIDEAQDTSPKQWEIIQKLVTEFFVGVNETDRTLFVVGDEKQSIFSFQGADPLHFSYMQNYFKEYIANNGFAFNVIKLPLSFRSTSAILNVVDTIFNNPEILKHVTYSESFIEHKAYRKDSPGLVTLWPITTVSDPEKQEAWSLPLYYKAEETVEAKLAEDIAFTIKNWLDNKRILQSKNRPITPGDILILVRRRKELSQLLISKLKKYDIPVAGLDRIKLNDNLAIMDLIALGQFMIVPVDDYSLACVLKSPLIGLGEEELFQLASSRGKNSLWQQLENLSAKNLIFQNAFIYLKDLLSKLEYGPYEFFSYIIDTKLGRRKFLERFGPEVLDPINSFLDILIEYEGYYIPSLQGFIEFFTKSDTEIKRDLEHGINQVRIMTVHSAKGLQAPIVFLPDTTFTTTNKDLLLWTIGQNLVFLSTKISNSSYCYDLKNIRAEKDKAENLRLLYVALTRAEDELIICGTQTKSNTKNKCWYDIIEEAVVKLGKIEEDGSWHVVSGYNEKIYIDNDIINADTLDSLPKFLNDKIPLELPYSYIAPTTLYREEKNYGSLLDYSSVSLLKGKLLHKLLQFLPKIGYTQREQFLKSFFIQNNYAPLSEIMKREIVNKSLALIDSPDLCSLFSANSRKELPLIGILNEKVIVTGQIDNLVTNKDEVIILDYKTTKYVPKNAQEIPVNYLRQLLLYRNLLHGIYNDKKVSCAIIWTYTATIMYIDDQLLNSVNIT